MMSTKNDQQMISTPPLPPFAKMNKSIAFLMKIQSSYLLLSYQRNQAYISHYISYLLKNVLVSLCQ